MILDNTLFGDVDKVAIAIELLREHEPPEGYYAAYSGGKDSDTILKLLKMAGVKYDAHYQLTTVDPPEVVQHIKAQPDIKIHHPEKTMWQLIKENGMPPLRQMRYCCRILKEGGGEGRSVVTGIRQQESIKRSKRRMVEQCNRDKLRTYINPIIDWSDADVWEFIRKYEIPYCCLYDEGWKRLGCVCCPNGNQQKQAERWPKIAAGYKKACIRAQESRIAKGLPIGGNFTTGEEMYDWWISGAGSTKEDDQTVMFE